MCHDLPWHLMLERVRFSSHTLSAVPLPSDLVLVLPLTLHRDRTIHGHPIHEPPLWQRIILDRAVQGAAVLPHEQVSHLPLMPVEKRGTEAKVGKLLNEGQDVCLRHADNPHAFARAHIDRFVPCDGMSPNITSGRSLTASARLLPGAYCFAPAR
jgi:hypothetical protein